MNNEELIKLLTVRSELAFEFIYKSYYRDLLNFAYSYLMNRELAEDFVHDVFQKMWESSESFVGVRNIKSYLFTAIKNRCINHFKHLSVIDDNMGKLSEAIIYSNTYSYVEDEELISKVNGCFDALPAAQQMVMKMRYVESMSYANIAEELGISTETVHTHVKRAFKFFRDNFAFFLFAVPHI